MKKKKEICNDNGNKVVTKCSKPGFCGSAALRRYSNRSGLTRRNNCAAVTFPCRKPADSSLPAFHFTVIVLRSVVRPMKKILKTIYGKIISVYNSKL